MGSGSSIRPFYAGWDRYNSRIVEAVRGMSPSHLQARPAEDHWPIWATVGHMAGARVYWLCGVLGEPGAETTPLADVIGGEGWEDDLETPRRADELSLALESTWHLIDDCLGRWTPAMLEESFLAPGGKRAHTRQSVLMRLLSHDAFHCGELSLTLGIHRSGLIDLWAPAGSAGDATT